MENNNNKKYDFAVVGAGFAGATAARLLTDKGYRCLIIEQRPFVSGNCVTDEQNGVIIHLFGAHILHTNNQDVWDFLESYGEIYQKEFVSLVWNNGTTYRLPYNGMDMIQSIHNVAWPYEAEEKLKQDRIAKDNIYNIEDYSLSKFGRKIYDTAIRGYYEKMYGRKCSELMWQSFQEQTDNKDIIYANSLYAEKYIGVPVKGYTAMVENIIGDDIDIMLNVDFLKDKDKFMNLANYTIYTGELDRFFNYCMGPLSWASATFSLDDNSNMTHNLSGCPVVRFNSDDTSWYRMTEHKWLMERPYDNEHTYVTYESFNEWEKGKECFYPLYTDQSIKLYTRYLNKLHEKYPNVLLCGRKAKYTYGHICDVVEDAMRLAEKFKERL